MTGRVSWPARTPNRFADAVAAETARQVRALALAAERQALNAWADAWEIGVQAVYVIAADDCGYGLAMSHPSGNMVQ